MFCLPSMYFFYAAETFKEDVKCGFEKDLAVAIEDNGINVYKILSML